MRLVIDSAIPYIRGQAERLGECVYLPGAEISPADVRGADALIVRTRTRCDSRLLEGSAVRFVATATIGYDHLDTAYLAQAGIGWANAPGCNAGSVAQYVECSLLRAAQAGLIPWPCTVGVVGVGHVGGRVAAMLRGYGCRVLLNDPPRAARGEGGFCDLGEIARQCDVVTLHTPLTVGGPCPTLRLIGADFFQRSARRPLLINTARGGVVDEGLLLRALADGTVRAAVVDTWEGEPRICGELLRAAFIATPHIAGYSADGKAAGTRMALEAVARHFGLPARFDVQPPALPQGFSYDASSPTPAGPLRLYDPLVDSRRLKAHPAAFEQLRNAYPLRREADDGSARGA